MTLTQDQQKLVEENICLCSSGKLYCDYCHGLMPIQHASHCEEGHENRGESL